MNREILYRAKRTDTGEWIEGYYSEIKLTSTPYILNGEIAIEPCKKGIVQFECYEVWPDTVCQYTGLTDKNGRKIFEGDIVETVCDGEQNPNYVVIWDKGELDFKVTNGEERYKGNYEYLGYCDEIIVIGNIFDNPELLRGA